MTSIRFHRTAARRIVELRTVAAAAGLMAVLSLAHAKLPAPSDEAKAKAAEAAAKTAHGNKVADFQLCKSQAAVAASYRESLKKAGKPVPTAADTPACADPGPFVYVPPVAAGTAAPVVAAAPATAAAAAPKKP
jgi:hypothetical protein